MKFVHPELQTVFDTENGRYNTLVIEEQRFLTRVLTDVASQIQGLEGASVMSIGDRPVPFARHARPTHELQNGLAYYRKVTNSTCFNHMYRLRRCLWIPTKGALARPTGNQYLPVRKFVSSGATFRVLPLLAQNPQILRERLHPGRKCIKIEWNP